MGTKGRDIFLYLFFFSAFITVTGRLLGFPVTFFFYLVLATGIAAVLYIPYLGLCKRWSRRLGLKCVVLLPVPLWQAKVLIFMAGEKLKGRAKRAFEIHIKSPNLGLSGFLKVLEGDLMTLKEKLPNSLFMWETTAPVPASIRSLIKEKHRKGEAFWKEGRWAVPHFPFTARDMRKGRVRFGAYIN